jgi:glycosyltransferase involved in cell wall biosynthesis
MKILHAVLTTGFYGSERYCAELAAAQARAGHDVTVLIHDAGASYVRAFRETIDAAKPAAKDVRPPQLVLIPRWAPAVLHRPLARLVLRRQRPDIVHTHLDAAARRVGEVARRLRIPDVATLHLGYQAREYQACDGLICLTEWQRASVPADFPGEAAVVWNWTPVAVREALARTGAEAVDALRHAWGAAAGTVVLGSVGRLMPEKGMDRLVRAFRAAFPGGDEPVRLVLVGDGPQRQALQRQAEADDRIVLAGEQRDVAPFYRAFDLYVGAARAEPFGLTILEAMAAGCPLVLTRSHGPLEFVTDRRVQWADAEDTDLADRLRAAAGRGRERFQYDMAPFASDRAVAAIERLYRRLAGRVPVA